MKIRFLLRIVVIALLYNILILKGIAQVSFQKGPKIVMDEKAEEIIGSDSLGVYGLRISNKGTKYHIIVAKYNVDSLTFDFFKEIDSEKIQQKLNSTSAPGSVKAFLVKNKVYVFFEAYDSKNKFQKLFLQMISSDGKLSDVFEVYSSDVKDEPEAKRNSLLSNFLVGFTEDKSSFWVCPIASDAYVFLKKLNKSTIITLYDAISLNKVYSREIDNSMLQRTDYYVQDFKVQSNGDMFFFKSISKANNKMIPLVLIERNSTTPKEFTFNSSLNSVWIESQYKVLSNNDIVISALVADTIKKSINIVDYKNVKLLVSKYRANTFEKISETTVNVSDSILTKLGSLDRTRINFDYLSINEVFDSYVLSFEYQNQNQALVPTPFLSYYNYEGNAFCNHLDIVLIKINNQGYVDWVRSVPQFIYKETPATMNELMGNSASYDIFALNKSLNIVVHENSLNIDSVLNKKGVDLLKIDPKQKVNVFVCSLLADGTISKNVIYTYGKPGFKYVSSKPFNSDLNRRVMFFENYRENMIRFGVLTGK